MPNKKELYHVGFLMRDRLFSSTVHQNALTRWKQYEKGKVHLLQKVRSLGVWEYWSVPNTGGKHVDPNSARRIYSRR